ncbi:MAG: hypothetical protein QNJ44_17150 [Rhodobacter sp.]|nr:hypothetical protein [Rhodobacter sp.]
MSSKAVSSNELESLLGRVHKSELSDGDKKVIGGLLEQSIELRKLMEGAAENDGGKRILASLPFGFDIVK